MPQSVFDLGGELTVDTTQLKSISEQVETELGKVSEQEAKATVSVDDARARSSVRDMQSALEDLRRAAEKKHVLDLDTSKSEAAAKSYGDTLGDELFGKARRDLAELEAAVQSMSTGRRGGIGQLLSGESGMAIGGMAAAAGMYGAFKIGSSAIKSAYAVDLMQKSTEQVFGAAADSYKAEAEKMADATGFMTTQILAAQIAMNKTVQLNSGEVTRDGRTIQVGLGAEQVQPLVARAADIAETTGLPQYANDLQAVTSAVVSGLQGSTAALLDFGIRLDDLYVLSLPVNEQFKKLGDTITPAEMAVARYNAIMEQTATIAGKASESQGDVNESLRVFNQKMEGAKEAVGEALIPVANTIADFISAIPKELLTAGVWAGLGAAMALTIGGAIVSLKSLIAVIRSLGHQAAATAMETAASGGGKGLLGKALGGGKGLLGKLGGGVATAAGGGAGAAGTATAAGTAAATGAATSAATSAATAATSAATTAASVSALSVGVAALPAAIAAGLLVWYGHNEKKNAEAELERAAHTSDLALRTSSLAYIRTTGQVGAGQGLTEDEIAKYQAVTWNHYGQGFNAYGQKLSFLGKDKTYDTPGAASQSFKTSVTIVDKTSTGVQLDSGAYEASVR